MKTQKMPAMRRSRLWLLSRLIGELLAALCFVIFLVAGALLHLGLPVSREAAGDLLERYLSATLQGTIEIGEFESLQGGGIAVRGVQVWDPDGKQVLSIERLEADIDPIDILRRVLSSNEKLSIEVKRVLVETSQLELLERSVKGRAENRLGLVDAFTPIPTAEAPANKKKSSRPIRLWFPRIELRDLQAHGSVKGSPVAQARVEKANAKLLITNKGVLLDIDRFGVRASGIAGTDTTAQGEFHLRVPGAIYGTVNGTIGDVPLEHSFRLENGTVDVQGNYPLLDPHQIRPLLGSWPIDTPLRGKLHAHGKLPNLEFETHFDALDQAHAETFGIDGDGSVDITLQTPAKVHLSATQLNLAQLNHALPRSSLDLEAETELDLSGAAPKATVSARLSRGVVADVALPPLEAEAHYQKDKWSADARINDGSTSSQLHAEQSAQGPILFSAQLKTADLARSDLLRPYSAGTSGAVQVDMHGSLDGEQNLNAEVKLSASHLKQATLSVASLALTTTVKGPIATPETLSGNTRVVATEVAAGQVLFKRVELSQSGTFQRPTLQAKAEWVEGTSITAGGTVSVQEQQVDGLVLKVEGRGTPIAITAKKAGYKGERILLQDFSMQSLGSISGDVDFHMSRGGRISLKAEGLQIARISEAAGLTQADLGGELDAEIDLNVGEHSSGTVEIDVKKGALLGFVGIDLQANTSINGRAVRGAAKAHIGGLGTLSSDFDGQLAGSPLYESSYRRAWGDLSLSLRDIDLATLTLLFGLKDTADLSGAADLQIDAARRQGQAPSLSLQAKTKNLLVVIPSQDKEGEPTYIRGIDLDGGMSLVPEESNLTAVVRLNDVYGQLASISGTQALPLAEWLEAPPSNQTLIDTLLLSPLNVVALAPERSVSQWPSFIPRFLDKGTTSARVALSGSIKTPELAVVINGENLAGRDTGLSRPINIDATMRYQATKGVLVGNLSIAEDELSLGNLAVNVALPAAHLFAPPPSDVPLWTGSIRAQLEDVPLDLPTSTKELGMGGRVEGSVLLERTGMMPDLIAELRARGLYADDYDIGDALISVQTHGTEVLAQTRLSDDYGELLAGAKLTFTQRGDRFGLSEDAPVIVDLRADKYNAAAVSPFLQDYFDDFSGILIGNIHAELSPSPDAKESFQTSLSGRLSMTGGHIVPTSIGLDMENVSTLMTAQTEDGFNVIRLNNITARVDSKTDNLKGRVALRLKNLSPHSGFFDFDVQSLLVTSGASPLATLTGRASGSIVQKDELIVSVKIDQLTAELAEAVDDQLIDVTENPSIVIVQNEKKTEKEQTGRETPLIIAIDLGQNMRVKNSLLDARVSGTPVIRIAEDTKVGGTIAVSQGTRFVVLGRTFVVERGLVLFDTGDAADPHLQIGATWTAPDNTLVRLTVGGTVSHPTLSWGSEPSLPGGEADVLALVIGGGGGGNSRSAYGTSLAVAANELNTIEGLEFYANQQAGGGEGRLSSINDSSWESYTAAYQISEKLWFEGSFQNQTIVGRLDGPKSGVSGTLDWRFHPQWSLRTEVGMLGAGLDLLWQYRY